MLAVAGDASPDVKIAYNTFNATLGSQRQDFIQVHPNMVVNLQYASGGGTRPDQAFNDARSFTWSADYDHRYVILVTDGAPQGGTAPSSGTIEDAVRNAASALKANSHVKLITVGLSMENVISGKRLLYDLADVDSSGNKMFYLAESGSDLGNIFRKITKVLMEDAVVIGNVTDTVSEGFYLVDKATGLPLQARDTLDIDGNRTTDPSKVAGMVRDDGKTVEWLNQAIDSESGWHGTVYVKAQEELLGGNGMKTNEGEATVTATKYHVGNQEVSFDTSLAHDTLHLESSLPTPRVNVNELTFFNSETEWTVYLGEKVDPKEQLKALYEGMVVEEVVNTDGSLHYTSGPNTIEERWDDATGTAVTFSLPDLIERLIRNDSAMTARYFNGTELDWDTFLEDIMAGGITLPYHEFGLTDNSKITITLEKTIVTGEEDDLINESPHATTVTGKEVEKYTLRVTYEPDYTVTPIGQGGQSPEDFHTGTFGTMYQGHATGRESSTNTHIINVYAIPLEIEKLDETDNTPLSGAEFKLYKVDENGQAVAGLDSAHGYVEVAATTSWSNGVSQLKQGSNDFELVLGEKYYLIETAAPPYYAKTNTIWEVTVETGNERYTPLVGTAATSGQTNVPIATGTRPSYPFNWDQDASILVNDAPIAVVKRGAAGTAEISTGEDFVTHTDVISFRYTVRNTPLTADVDIPIKKILRGRDMAAGEFAFVLQPINTAGERDNVAKQIMYNPPGSADAAVTFPFSLHYGVEDIKRAPYHDADDHPVFFYVVYEEAGEATDIVYSKQQYIVKVTLSVSDDGINVTKEYYQYDGESPLPQDALDNFPTRVNA